MRLVQISGLPVNTLSAQENIFQIQSVQGSLFPPPSPRLLSW